MRLRKFGATCRLKRMMMARSEVNDHPRYALRPRHAAGLEVDHQPRRRLAGSPARQQPTHRGAEERRHPLYGQALPAMGVSVEEPDDTSFIVTVGAHCSPGRTVVLGNAGTATRFLAAAWRSSTARWCRRRLRTVRVASDRPLVDALRSLGVDAEAEKRSSAGDGQGTAAAGRRPGRGRRQPVEPVRVGAC